ncbi:MAG TPA: ABC transporter permease [Treponema sp.]|nr:ABC transporter permease [Treponema sp.]
MIRIVAKTELNRKRTTCMRILAVTAALAAAAVIMLCMELNPFKIYGQIIAGSLGSAYRLRETVNKAIPLTVLSLGIGIAFRMKFWNIGAEGQLFMGAFGASLVAFAFPDMPRPVLLICMMLSSFIFGGLWALVPAGLKIKFNASETLVTLMLNYVAQLWIGYLQYGPWRDPAANGFPKIAHFTQNAVLPKLFGIHIGWILTLALAVIFSVIFRHTKFGYEIDVLGESEATAHYAGINVPRVLLVTVMLSGGLCGFAGMMQASAIENSLSEQLSGGMGFTAVITTWLAQLDPLLMVLVSFLFSMLIQGGNFLQSAMRIPSSMSQILEGIIIFFVLGSEFFIRYRFVFVKKPYRAATAEEAEK